MITEDYVSFETAKLLKEKGFDEPCEAWYAEYTSVWGVDSSGDRKYIVIQFDDKNRFDEDYKFLCYAPTLQMAMRWLRDVHHIVLVVDYDYECTDKSYCYKVYCLGENGKPKRVPIYGVGYDIEGNQYRELVSYRDYERSCFEYVKYEEACEAGFKYCLENLI